MWDRVTCHAPVTCTSGSDDGTENAWRLLFMSFLYAGVVPLSERLTDNEECVMAIVQHARMSRKSIRSTSRAAWTVGHDTRALPAGQHQMVGVVF